MGSQLPPERGTAPHFSVHVLRGQTAGWMKTRLGTEVDLSPGHIVLDGVPALCERGTAASPLFGPCLLWPLSPISATAELLFVGMQCMLASELSSTVENLSQFIVKRLGYPLFC